MHSDDHHTGITLVHAIISSCKTFVTVQFLSFMCNLIDNNKCPFIVSEALKWYVDLPLII